MAKLIKEMETDVVVWRTDDIAGAKEVMYGRFIVAQSEDHSITADARATTYTCHDYFAMLARRYLTKPVTYTGHDPKRHCDLASATGHDRPNVGRRPQILYAGFRTLPLRPSVTAPDGSPGVSWPRYATAPIRRNRPSDS